MQFKYIKKSILVLLSLCFIFSSVFGTTSVYAANTSQLKDKKQKIQSQIDEAQKSIDKISSEKKKTQDYISTLDKKITLLQDKIDVLQEDADDLQNSINKIQNNINKTENDINDIQKQIDEKQAQFDKTFDEYCQRLRAMYISGHASNLEVLLTSSDISSILTRSEMIKSVSRRDSETLDYLTTQMEEIEKEKAELEKKRNQLSENKKNLESDKKALTDNISEVAASKKELDKEVAECNALIKKYANDSSEYMETISTNKKEIEEVEREIQEAYRKAQQNNNNSKKPSSPSKPSPDKGSGKFIYPTSYHTISSGFYRNSGSYHGALDFPCPVGTPVYASASGTVILTRTGWGGGYGNYVMIDHGNGYSTLYAHNSKLLVSTGEHVSQGDVIAKSGNTGRSTGPHCHFEIRINGSKVNPANYL